MNTKYIIAIMIIALTGFYFEFYHNKEKVIDNSYMEYVR